MELNKKILRILIENDSDSSADSDVNQGMSDAISNLKSGLANLKNVKIDEPKKESLINESIGSIVASGLLAAPKLIEWLGKAIAFISKKFAKKDESSAAKNIEKFGKKWENIYIKLLEGAIKMTGFLKSTWKKEDGKVDEEKLHLIAKVLYAVILGVALASAVKGVIHPNSLVLKSIEAILGTVKATEIAAIIKLVLPKFGLTAAA